MNTGLAKRFFAVDIRKSIDTLTEGPILELFEKLIEEEFLDHACWFARISVILIEAINKDSHLNRYKVTDLGPVIRKQYEISTRIVSVKPE